MNDDHEKVGAGLTHGHSKDDGSGAVLISAFVDPEGRDSLGRGLDARSVQAAVEADWGVRNEARAQGNYLAALTAIRRLQASPSKRSSSMRGR